MGLPLKLFLVNEIAEEIQGQMCYKTMFQAAGPNVIGAGPQSLALNPEALFWLTCPFCGVPFKWTWHFM